jgi:hypothetical protein
MTADLPLLIRLAQFMRRPTVQRTPWIAGPFGLTSEYLSAALTARKLGRRMRQIPDKRH